MEDRDSKPAASQEQKGQPKTEHLVEGQRFQFAKSKTEYVIGKGGEARRVAGKLIPKKLRNKLKREVFKAGATWNGSAGQEAVDRNLYEYKQQRGSLV